MKIIFPIHLLENEKNVLGLGSMNKTGKCQWRTGEWKIRGEMENHFIYFVQ